MTPFLSCRRLAFLLFLLLPLWIFGCSSSEKNKDLNQLEWLLGRWENEVNGIKTIETWTRKPDKSYLVKGYMLEAYDTVFIETISVEKARAGIIYQVVIADQNNGKPVTFKLTQSSGSQAVFENPKHDFPQKIRYAKLSEDSLQVKIEGQVKGKPVKETYILRKSTDQLL